MTVAASEPQQILLLLDLASDNPIPEDELLEHLPEAPVRHTLRLSEFGVQPTTRGQVWSRWKDCMLGIDKMLAHAQTLVDPRRSPHYYVAGRASLPLFSYLGLRRGKPGKLTVINQRDSSAWDVIPTNPADAPGSQPFFRPPVVTPGPSERGRVAVCVSTGYAVSSAEVTDYLARNGEEHAATVMLATEAGSARWLSADNAGIAALQIRETLSDLRRHAPRARGTSLFIAGPAPIAVMAGRSLNPHMQGPIWMPAYDMGVYREAVQWPRGAIHGEQIRVLLFTASPANMVGIGVLEEEREIVARIRAGLDRNDRVKIYPVRGASPRDILQAMNELRPHVVHISAHGNQEGDLAFLNEEGDAAMVPLRGLAAAMKTAADQVQVVVLNACYSQVAAAALNEFVDCAIGVRRRLVDKSALEFAGAFYAALGYGRSVRQAYEQGLAQLQVSNLPNSEDIELLVRLGCDASEWIPLPNVAESTPVRG